MYIMRKFILVGRERERGEGGTDGWMDGTERERERDLEARKRGGGWIGYGRMDQWMDMERLMDEWMDV